MISMLNGLLLYILTLIIEGFSVGARFMLLLAALSFGLPIAQAILVSAAVALLPVLMSLLVLAGLPSGHLTVRFRLRGRVPNPTERALLAYGFGRLATPAERQPRAMYVLDEEGINAIMAGTTLYVYRDVLRNPYLAAVLAHELGHYHTLDSRLSLSLNTLVIPGAYLFAFALLTLMDLLVSFIIGVLNGIISVTRWYWLVQLLQPPVTLLLIVLPREIIILAMGGFGPRLLHSAWLAHFRGREFSADAYAAQLGQAVPLIKLFRQIDVLHDVSLPWSDEPTHPPTRQRIERLVAYVKGQIKPAR